MLKRAQYDWEDISDLLTEEIECKNTFTIVCNGELTEAIVGFIEFELGNDVNVHADVWETYDYIISASYTEGDYKLYVNRLHNDDGFFTEHSCDGFGYIFSNDITLSELDEFIDVDETILCEFLEEDEEFTCPHFDDCEFCDCENCEEYDDDFECPACKFDEDMNEAIGFALETTSDPKSCVDCKVQAILLVAKVFLDAKENGFDVSIV